jgi:hypothetical protein
MRPRNLQPIIVSLAVSAAALACAFIPSTPSPHSIQTAIAETVAAMPSPTAPAPAGTSTPAPTAPAAAPATAEPTAPPPAAPACAPGHDAGPLVLPESFADYPEAILGYLNDGGTPDGLQAALTGAGAVSETAGEVQYADLTGDGTPEFIVAILDPTAEPLGPLPPGQLFIFTCDTEGARSQAYDSGYTGERSLPLIQFVQDVTGDGTADLLYTVSMCGAHTCFDTLSVIRWDGAAFVNAVNGDTTMAYATISLAPGAAGFASDIVMYGGTVGSVGAGPQRPRTNIWSWDGAAYNLATTFPDPALYRIHALNDADDATLAGDNPTALVLYQRVIDDDSLLAWEPIADERERLGGYAKYRIMILRLQAGEIAEAANLRNELLTRSVAGAPGGEWGPVAEAFFARFEQEEDANAACGDVQAYLNTDPAALEPLNSYGYENRTYDATTVCPY